jgi:phosphoglycolate phosphatase
MPGCGVTLDDCAYVGDTEIDAEACRRAGIPFLLFTEGYRKSPVEMLAAQSSFANFRLLPGLIRALI